MLDSDTAEFTEEFTFYRNLAQDALKIAQAYQEKYYNKTHILREFELGDQVLINLHSLQLLRGFKGRGRKLLPRFEGPFEIIAKISPVAYRLRLPASYQGHPILNIAHLEPYHLPESIAPNRPKLKNTRGGFEELEEFEVDKIIDSKIIKIDRGRRVRKYRVCWKGYEAQHDTWETARNLKNSPKALKEYQRHQLDLTISSVVPTS